jgi:hypothetical protein
MPAAKARTKSTLSASDFIRAQPASMSVAEVLFLLALPYAETACIATGLYTTPDTLAPGKVQGVAMLDAWQVERNTGPPPGGLFGDRHQQLEGVLIIPSAMVRWGVVNNVEVGLGTLRADAKWRVLHTNTVSVAIDPIVRGDLLYGNDGEVAELPVLVGLRVEDGVVVVANAGLTYSHILVADGPYIDNLAVRAGLGVRLQLGRLVAVQPEVTYLRSIVGRSLDWLSGGVAMQFGGLP